MLYRYRELRRLWEVEVYNGDPDDPTTTTRTETVIALNHVDAIRRVSGGVVSPPKPLHYVTWPDGSESQIYRIDNPSVGPIGNPILPSVPLSVEEEDWIGTSVETVKKTKPPKKPHKDSQKKLIKE